MSVEIVAPAEEEQDLKIVQTVVAESFRASWVR
jgi:hypothetical protein